ncbi:2-dehydro-3-deoxygalactonokinase [Sphingomonas glacialis]|uniref:2-dehydro-3-deoxygalactonokinase n=1 Tax=Sphingomonas glacialis TaxID=658225 RepID=A0A502FWX1_9SPHN|nr:2-dehydro-3-deoxygalactonokinase [Sphingomonas glacialis]TPG54127.1 2-dehydro-3-deoxygalactonokinase [Sphingomonas glacialis]
MSYRIVGDWGTSRLRLFRIEAGHVVARVEAAGIGALEDTPEATLRTAIAPWRADGEPQAITLCGMVGSRNGWIEVPYAACPADVAGWAAEAGRIALDGVPVAILAGLACTAPSGGPDVMRGEETQLFGAIARDPVLRTGRHRIALPGTHSKWATIEDGRIVAFQTFFTGELFALLRDRSTLLRAAARSDADPAAEQAGFAHGLTRAGDGDLLLGALFEARSAQLIEGRSPDWAAGYLSGLLIGREIAELAPTAGETVGLIGDPALCDRYARALAARGIDTNLLDGDACVLAGLALMETDR